MTARHHHETEDRREPGACPPRPWTGPVVGLLAAAVWVAVWTAVDWLWPLPSWIRFAGMVASLGAMGAAAGAALDRWRAGSLTDPLTGLGNRRLLNTELKRALAQAQRHRYPLALVLIDLDQFKAFNDQRGHWAGDQLLRHLASLLGAGLRAGDLAIRLGGDEFLLALPHTARDAAQQAARRLEQRLREETGVGFSFGVAVVPEDGTTVMELIRAADRDLYRLKGGPEAR